MVGLTDELRLALEAWTPVREQLELATSVSAFAEGKSPDNRLQMRLSAYVLAYRLTQVVAAANARLAGMSDQRYSLEHVGQRGAGESRGGLSLVVRDDWSGESRDPATLSGGETFVVSLALALGLADVVAHEAGGADLATLFVDEGFGSLDAETLDDVLDILDTLRENGRAVGVVSHVAEMRDRIPTQLVVTKARTGVHGPGLLLTPLGSVACLVSTPDSPHSPTARLGDAALARARELGASHADFRFERVRYQDVRRARRRLQGAGDAEDLGFAVRVVHGGAWGFASGVAPHRRRGRAGRRDGGRGRPGGRRDDDRAGRDRARAGVRRRRAGCRRTTSTRSTCRSPRRSRCSSTGPSGCAGTPAVDHATAELLAGAENKYYADLAGTRTTQQRVRLMPAFDRDGRRRQHRHLRLRCARIAPPVGRGWEYLAGGADGWDWDAELAELPELLAEKLGRRPSRPGSYDLVIHPSQPLADHPRVDRPRHRARPGARLRGQLRRHVVRDVSTSSARCSTARRS